MIEEMFRGGGHLWVSSAYTDKGVVPTVSGTYYLSLRYSAREKKFFASRKVVYMVDEPFHRFRSRNSYFFYILAYYTLSVHGLLHAID
jgi:hypothetical protein